MAKLSARTAETRQVVAGRPIPDAIRIEIVSRLRLGATPEQIAKGLEALHEEGLLVPEPPAARTIRWYIATGKVSRPKRPADAWSLLDGPADDVALVLPAVPIIATLPVTARWLSVREAEAIARVRRAAPDIPLAAAVTLATVYVSEEQARTNDLDLYVACAPWRSPKAQDSYEATAEAAGTRPLWVSPDMPGELIVGVKSGRANVTASASVRADATVTRTDKPKED